MNIGLPKEIKNGEHRVALTPHGVAELVAHGHRVVFESMAGIDSGYTDEAYRQAGAECADVQVVWNCAMVVKVKEPLASEYAYFYPGLILFTYLHLAASPELQQHLCDAHVSAIAYETIQLEDGSLPLLKPMSQIAGRVSASLGLHYLMRNNGTDFPGMGRIAGGIAGVEHVSVMIIGAGNVGLHAASVAAAMGADVVLAEASTMRMQQLQRSYPQYTLISPVHIVDYLTKCQLLIGAALLAGQRAPMLLKRKDIAQMAAGSVFVDVAIDQGGVSETSRVTSHDQPVYCEEGVIHCCLPNLPAMVPLSSTQALTSATLPYVLALADKGLNRAIEQHAELNSGVNTFAGKLMHPALIDA